MKNFWQQIKFKYWMGGLLGGPGISIILQKWVISNPPEWLVALIYVLGFGIYGLAIILSYKHRIKQIDFLKYMVHTREEKKLLDGSVEIKDFGRIDENSVKIVEKLKELTMID